MASRCTTGSVVSLCAGQSLNVTVRNPCCCQRPDSQSELVAVGDGASSREDDKRDGEGGAFLSYVSYIGVS